MPQHWCVRNQGCLEGKEGERWDFGGNTSFTQLGSSSRAACPAAALASRNQSSPEIPSLLWLVPNSIWIHLPWPARECFPLLLAGSGNESLEWMPSAMGYWRHPVACDSSTRVGLLSCKQPGISLSYTCKAAQWPREERSAQKHCLSCLNKAESLHVHSWIISRAKENMYFLTAPTAPLTASQNKWSVCLWVLWIALWAFLWTSVHHSYQSMLTKRQGYKSTYSLEAGSDYWFCL